MWYRFQFEIPSLADPNDEEVDPSPTHEDDLAPVDDHRSVIMHLLSQLKLGMDLTKVDCSASSRLSLDPKL